MLRPLAISICVAFCLPPSLAQSSDSERTAPPPPTLVRQVPRVQVVDPVFDDIPLEKLRELSIFYRETPYSSYDAWRGVPFYLPHGAAYAIDPFGSYGPCSPHNAWYLSSADPWWAGRGGSYRRLYHYRDMKQRSARLLNKRDEAVRSGLDLLREGEFSRAVVALTLAAKLDHGDPTCRMHLAQARLALGQYADAGKLIRRALELQPKLVYADLHFDREYPERGQLAGIADGLDAAIGAADGEPGFETRLAQGFVRFQLGEFDAAREAFLIAARLEPKNEAVRDYLEICKPAEKVAEARPADSGR